MAAVWENGVDYGNFPCEWRDKWNTDHYHAQNTDEGDNHAVGKKMSENGHLLEWLWKRTAYERFPVIHYMFIGGALRCNPEIHQQDGDHENKGDMKQLHIGR